MDQAPTPPTPPETQQTTTPTESKPPSEGSTPPAPSVEAKPEAKPDAKPTVPDAYADFTVPDGYNLDKATIEKAAPIFKDLGLTQEQAQRLVDFHAEQMINAAKGPQETYENLRTSWRAEVTNDSEIKAYTTEGKTGIDAVKVDIGRALSSLDPKLAGDFKAAMDLTGAGDNPAFVKALWKLSQNIVEGKPVSGGGPSPLGQKAPGEASRPSAAKSLYPNLA